MKQSLFIITLIVLTNLASGQHFKKDVSKACLDYIEGFYEGDTTKLIKCLMPSLYKFGYWKDKTSGKYASDGQMTYRKALDYAKTVSDKKQFAKPDAPKKVDVLDIQNYDCVRKSYSLVGNRLHSTFETEWLMDDWANIMGRTLAEIANQLL